MPEYGVPRPKGWIDPNEVLGILVENFGCEEQYLNDVEFHARVDTAWLCIMQLIDGQGGSDG